MKTEPEEGTSCHEDSSIIRHDTLTGMYTEGPPLARLQVAAH